MHRFRIRLILALIFSVTVVSVATTCFDVLAHRHVLSRELDRRTQWMGISLLPDVEEGVRSGNPAALGRLLQLLRSGTGALDLAVYDLQGHLPASAGDASLLGSPCAPPAKTGGPTNALYQFDNKHRVMTLCS